MSPECPPLPENSDPKLGDSLTEFRAELMRYLSAYHVPALQEWISRIRQTDFSKVRYVHRIFKAIRFIQIYLHNNQVK